MRNPLLNFFRQVNEWLGAQAESLDGVDERTRRRWFNKGDDPSGDGAQQVAVWLWKRCLEPRKHPADEPNRLKFKQWFFQKLHQMDIDAPAEDAAEPALAAYFHDLANRCRSRVTLEVLIERDREKRFRVVTDNGVAPVPAGAKVRLRVNATYPVFHYLVWIDSQGGLMPLFPWQPGNWQQLRSQQPQKVLDLPEGPPGYWLIDTPAGLETVVAMASVFRLPEATLTKLDLRLNGLGVPRSLAHLPPVVPFASEGGAASEQRLNVNPPISERERLAWRHRDLIQRLQAAAFDHVVGWSFANAGAKGVKG